MGTTSVLLTSVNALYTTLNVASVTGAVTPAAVAYDGPPIVDRSSAVELWVGATGLDPDEEVITLQRVPVAFGGGSAGALRDEVVSAPCAIWAIRGENDPTSVQDLRTQVGAVFDAVCARLSAGSGDLGLGAVLCGGVEVREGNLRQIQSPDGFSVVLTFTVQISAQV